MKKSNYQRIKDANHKSPNLTSFMRRNPFCRFYAFAHRDDRVSFKKMESMSVKELYDRFTIYVGYLPMKNIKEVEKTPRRLIYSITGANLARIVCNNKAPVNHLIGLQGAKCIDVTERFIEEYNKVGMCSIHDSRHENVLISPKRRRCTVCGQVAKSKVVWVKRVQWELV